ncbi:MAG: dihydrofolate reductase, partial [Chlamydiia bacterium]|nr:dihydrofolate reductase [Chlamydiia bacterium]
MKSDRPRISAFVGTSLDGYIAKEDDDLLWLESIPAEGEDYGFATFFEGVDVLIMGRRTYEVVSGFDAWPYEGKWVIVL